MNVPHVGNRVGFPRLIVAALVMAGCGRYDPKPLDQIPFMERAETLERDGIRVTVAVLDREEARNAFGIDLEKKKIQPIWLEVENQTELPRVFLFSALDPSYYSAGEAAYKSHYRFRWGTNKKIDAHFAAHDFESYVAPHSTIAGFVFSTLKLGTREVRVKLYNPQSVELFEFYVPVQGFEADYRGVDFESLYETGEVIELDDQAELRDRLRALPCCTQNNLGIGKGDPLNLILIGSGDEVHQALIRSGWDETERLTFGSAWRSFKAFFGGTYKYSPMSSLYLYERGQDAGFQKARDTIHERNHLRLWLSPMRYRGQLVWIGTITRDIGVYFTTRAWNLTTHAIDPNVDEARRYVMEDLLISESVERLGFVSGVGKATEEAPHRNFMQAPWWTDGLRLVLDLSETPVPLEDVRFFYWDWRNIDPEDMLRVRDILEGPEEVTPPDSTAMSRGMHAPAGRDLLDLATRNCSGLLAVVQELHVGARVPTNDLASRTASVTDADRRRGT